ncbi:MAG: nitroreductase family protein [Opitutales bacterium]
MDAITMIKERRSVRKYTSEKISRELMTEIVDLAKWSPSWANQQIARYTIIDNPETIKALVNEGVHKFSYNMNTLAHASSVAVISYVKGKSGVVPAQYGVEGLKPMDWEMFDSGIACQTFCLAAHAKGVGTCIFGIMDSEKISELLSVPAEETVAVVIACGIEDGTHASPTPRKELNEILRFI